MKICTKCNEEKSSENFYSKQRWCKTCFLEYNRSERVKLYQAGLRKTEKWRERNREAQRRYRERHGVIQNSTYNKVYSSEWRKRNPMYYKEYRKNHIEKVTARVKLNNKICRGEIIREVCSVCGSKNAEGHHQDYGKPFDVIWLCKKHHEEFHMIKK